MHPKYQEPSTLLWYSALYHCTVGYTVPRGNCKLRFENSYLEMGHFKMGYFIKPYLSFHFTSKVGLNSFMTNNIRVVNFLKGSFLQHIFQFFANSKTRMHVSTPSPGSWLAPWASKIDLSVSADALDVRNDLQGGPHPQAIENKKTEYVLQKSLSEILVPVNLHCARGSKKER